MSGKSKSVYVESQGLRLFTAVSLPEGQGPFPVILRRDPYVSQMINMSDGEVLAFYAEEDRRWTDAGYAVVTQHCRGCGKSEGDFLPFVNERTDGLALLDWVRRQNFYGGELYFIGASYCSSVFLLLAPYAPDVKGLIFHVQDGRPYHTFYRNGQFKVGFAGLWYVWMYKNKSMPDRSGFSPDSFRELPLQGFSERIFGERAETWEETLRHPMEDDPYWEMNPFIRPEYVDALTHARIPILMTTQFYDMCISGVIKLWNRLDGETRRQSALIIGPYDHDDKSIPPVTYPLGKINEAFPDYELRWLEHIRHRAESPVPMGEMTYYRLFGNHWQTEALCDGDSLLHFPLGEGTFSYRYDPKDPASFPGGLSSSFGGAAWQDRPGRRQDILTFYTPAFEADTFLKGKASARLVVSSSAEDSCFYMRLSVCKAEGDFGLRDDIQTIVRCYPDYRPGEKVELTFQFDEHAVLIRKGERLRIDVSSSDWPHFLPHTNTRGLYSEQTVSVVATNTIYASESELLLPCER